MRIDHLTASEIEASDEALPPLNRSGVPGLGQFFPNLCGIPFLKQLEQVFDHLCTDY